jgi:hypothetical protein
MRHEGNSGGVDPGMREAGYILSSTMPGVAQFFAIVSNIFIIVLGWWSILVEVFLRRDFGERYLSWLRLLFAFGILTTIWRVTQFFTFWGIPIFSSTPSTILSLFTVGFVICSAMHRLGIWLKNKKGEAWHSRSFGTSRLAALNLPFIGTDDWMFYRLYEPLLCLLLAYIISHFDIVAGFIIGVSSVALLLKNNLVYLQQRGRILDLIDAKIEGIFYNEQAYGKPKQDVAGISVVKVVWPKLPPAPSSLDDIETTVNSALRNNPAGTPATNGKAEAPRDSATLPKA